MIKPKKNSQVKHYTFTACFISGTTNLQKFGGVGGYSLEKNFSTDSHELEKQPKTKVGGQLSPLSPPPPLAAPLIYKNVQNNI